MRSNRSNCHSCLDIIHRCLSFKASVFVQSLEDMEPEPPSKFREDDIYKCRKVFIKVFCICFVFVIDYRHYIRHGWLRTKFSWMLFFVFEISGRELFSKPAPYWGISELGFTQTTGLEERFTGGTYEVTFGTLIYRRPGYLQTDRTLQF